MLIPTLQCRQALSRPPAHRGPEGGPAAPVVRDELLPQLGRKARPDQPPCEVRLVAGRAEGDKADQHSRV
jgi:hypothetical protein